jgi:hypothetical protein
MVSHLVRLAKYSQIYVNSEAYNYIPILKILLKCMMGKTEYLHAKQCSWIPASYHV